MDFVWISVGAEDHLFFMWGVDSVEDMEEFEAAFFFTGEELDVIDEEDVEGSIF